MVREVTKEDILRLLEIKMQRILKFNKDKADELIARIKADIERLDYELAHMVDVTVEWFEMLLEKYGKDHPRLTEIKNFDTIVASKVVEANEKLYINRAEGFIGTGLKKDEYVCTVLDEKQRYGRLKRFKRQFQSAPPLSLNNRLGWFYTSCYG